MYTAFFLFSFNSLKDSFIKLILFLCKSDIYFACTGQVSGSKAFSRKVSSWSNDFHSEIRGLKETEGAKATYPLYEPCLPKCVCVFHGGANRSEYDSG